MKKRVLAMLLAGMMVFSLAACGGDSNNQTPDPGTQEPSGNEEPAAGGEEYKIALLMSHQTNAFVTAVGNGAKDKAAELGVVVEIFDGNQDPATQISQIETAINLGYDGILVEPVSADGIVPGVKAANDAGIPVITVVQQMANQEEMAVAYAGGNESVAGGLQMKNAVEAMGGEGNIAVIYGPMGSDAQIARNNGYEETLADYPNVEVVLSATANWNTEEALSLVENWISTGTTINAIVSQNDSMAMGALKAVEDAGLDIPVYGLDAVDDALAAIAAGRLGATVSQDAYGQGALGVELMVKHLNNETVEPFNYTECVWIDSSNIADYQ